MLEHEIKMNQKVERFTQFSGSDVLSTPSSSSDGYSESEVNQLLQNKSNKIHQHLFTDLVDAPDSYTGQSRKLLRVSEDETTVEFIPPESRSFLMHIGGLAKVNTGAVSVIVPMGLRITQVRLGADTAPVGSALILDLNRNGVTLYSSQANRPQLPPGVTDTVALLPEITTLALGDKLRLDIDQVGSLTPGAGLSLTIICEVV